MKIGFIGYSDESKFDIDEGKDAVKNAFSFLRNKFGSLHDIVVVSGGTDMGIPKLVYEFADENSLKTIAVIPKEAFQYQMFPCDEFIVEGENFGDESEALIEEIDFLVKIGGGKQSQKELEIAINSKIPYLEIPL